MLCQGGIHSSIAFAELDASLGLNVDLYFCRTWHCPLEHSQVLGIWREIQMTDLGLVVRKVHFAVQFPVGCQQPPSQTGALSM